MGAHPETTSQKKDETLKEAIWNLEKLDHPWEHNCNLDLTQDPPVEIFIPFSNIECMVIEGAFKKFESSKSNDTRFLNIRRGFVIDFKEMEMNAIDDERCRLAVKRV